MIEQVLQETGSRMDHVIDGVKRDLQGIRTGRASLSMVDGVMVNAYGSDMPLNQVATLAVPEPALITVKPFDQGLLGAIEKAINKADIGITPANDGKLIRLPVPQLTEERRKQLSKKVNEVTEHGKTSIRNIRREANDKVKKLEKDGHVGADDARKLLDKVQELTDKHVKTLDKMAETKTAEIMTV